MFDDCPVCGSITVETRKVKGRSGLIYDCKYCGSFFLTEESDEDLRDSKATKEQKFLLSHAVRRRYEVEKKFFELDSTATQKIIKENVLPKPSAMAEYLILFLGDYQEAPGKPLTIDSEVLKKVLGTQNEEDIRYISLELEKDECITKRSDLMGFHLRLTFKGWEKYEKLKHGITNSNRVFMAMRFGNSDLDTLFNTHYKPTLRKLGYELFRLDEDPKAGSITNRMRVAIKESKFVIADLSYGNRGAYWEAGFGEGLGKHVIYSVNESTLDKDHHFDVQGQQAVIWTTDKMDKAAKDLEACVKATFF